MKYDLLIVDGPYLAHRSYCAPYKLTTSEGLDATLIHSFFRSLNALRKKFTPDQIIVTWESYGTVSWRREIFPFYKKQRRKVSEEYVNGVQDTQLLLDKLKVKQYYSPNNEADDVIAKLVEENQLLNVLIFTVDKDIMQLVSSKCHVWNGKDMFDEEAVRNKFGVEPENIPDFLAVKGDSSDDIPGIKGYGDRKTAQLIRNYKEIENIPEDNTISKYKNTIERNKKLTVLNKNCTLVEMENKDFKSNENISITDILDKYQLKKMSEELGEFKKLGVRGGTLDRWLNG